MKARKETTLFRVLTGSRLYGTATEKSDFDYKAVCLPPLDVLMLNTKVTNRKEKPEGSKAGDKMLAGETETEYLPLQVFFDDFFSGQTYALEVAFATAQGLHEASDLGNGETANWWHMKYMMEDLVKRFTTSNVKKMVGYAVSQSQLYGLKTERFTSLKKAVELLTEHVAFFGDKVPLGDETSLLAKLLSLSHVKKVQIENSAGGSALAPAVDVVGKKYPYTNKVGTVLASLQNLLDGYGARVAAFEGEGVDWKALSHATRITEQVLELSSTGKLVFPRPNADFLRTVKNGEVSLDEATAYLQNAFSKVDAAVAASVLQERTAELEEAFREWKLWQLSALYSRELKSFADNS